MKKSTYNKLSSEEKYFLFTGNNISDSKIENQNDLDFYQRERLGYVVINDFLIAEEAVEFEREQLGRLVNKLEIGTKINSLDRYESIYPNGFLLSSGYFNCKGVYDWVNDKWYYNSQFETFRILNRNYVQSLTTLSIKIAKLVNEEKSFWGNKLYVEEIELFPFLDNHINQKMMNWRNSELVDTVGLSEISEYRYDREKFGNRPVDFWTFIESGDFSDYILNDREIDRLKQLYTVLEEYVREVYHTYILKPQMVKSKEVLRTKKLAKNIVQQELVDNGLGISSIIEGENVLIDLVQKHEQIIIEVDYKLIQKIIRLNNFIKTRRENLLKLYSLIEEVESKSDLDDFLAVLSTSVDVYNALFVNAINMVVAIKDKRLVVFYEIYEIFDKLNVFDSRWEHELSESLNGISGILREIVFSVKTMDYNLNLALSELSYMTQKSFSGLQESVVGELTSLRKGVGLNNLLTGINLYYTRKMSKKLN